MKIKRGSLKNIGITRLQKYSGYYWTPLLYHILIIIKKIYSINKQFNFFFLYIPLYY
jgi:hypothetical protein